MTLHFCPRCQRRYVISEGTGEVDFVHECDSGNLTLDNEDVVKTGDWEDYTGSEAVNNANLQGTENKLFGTRAGIEGEDLGEFTRRGNRASTRRQRQHFEFINLKGGMEK